MAEALALAQQRLDTQLKLEAEVKAAEKGKVQLGRYKDKVLDLTSKLADEGAEVERRRVGMEQLEKEVESLKQERRALEQQLEGARLEAEASEARNGLQSGALGASASGLSLEDQERIQRLEAENKALREGQSGGREEQVCLAYRLAIVLDAC